MTVRSSPTWRLQSHRLSRGSRPKRPILVTRDTFQPGLCHEGIEHATVTRRRSYRARFLWQLNQERNIMRMTMMMPMRMAMRMTMPYDEDTSHWRGEGGGGRTGIMYRGLEFSGFGLLGFGGLEFWGLGFRVSWGLGFI